MAKRDPLQVSPQFRIGLIQLQSKLELKEKRRISIRELTEKIANSNILDEIEKKLISSISQLDRSLKLNFDKRRK